MSVLSRRGGTTSSGSCRRGELVWQPRSTTGSTPNSATGAAIRKRALVVTTNVKHRLEGRHPTEKYGLPFLYRNPMLEGPCSSRTPDDLGVSSI